VTLQIHRSERADALVRALGDLLGDVPADPFTPEVVAVPSKGVERWITQSLASSRGRDGICANVQFPSPFRLVTEVLTAGTGVDPRDDPWVEERLTWALLEVVERCGGEAWCATLGRHLGLGNQLGNELGNELGGARVDQGRRVGTAQKLAALFSRYAAERPMMLREWAAGRDTDGFGLALEEDLTWQAELWRRVRREIGSDSPADRLEAACARLRDEPGLIGLPQRLSVFGPTRLTTEQLQVLDALAEHRDVHLWVPHPSDALWRKVPRMDVVP